METSAYCSAAAGIVMLTRCSALELAKYGIRVNTVMPGLTDTELARRCTPRQRDWDEAAQKNLCGKTGEPEDIAEVVLLLLSEGANYVNGTEVVVDGGSLLT